MSHPMRPKKVDSKCGGCGQQPRNMLAYGVFNHNIKRHERVWLCAAGTTAKPECMSAYNEKKKAGLTT